jgi:transcriptional regulator with XRE-family HTH domain
MVGRRLRELRVGAKISRKALAKQIGVSVTAVIKWETDKASPELQRLCVIAQALEVETHELLRRVGEPVTAAMLVGYDQEVLQWWVRFGQRLKKTREALRLPIAGVAAACSYPGMSVDTLIDLWPRYEAGEAVPNPIVCERFCDTFGVTLEWLCRGLVRSRLSDDVLFPLLAADPTVIARDPSVLADNRQF